MRELSGVTLLYPEFFQSLKQRALLFDAFYVYGLSSIDYLGIPDNVKADIDFLRSKDILKEIPTKVWIEVGSEAHAREEYKKLVGLFDNATVNDYNVGLDHDYFTRIASAKMAAEYGIATAPICQFDFPTELFGSTKQPRQAAREPILRVALSALPAPDNTCSWEDILNFRAEVRDKQWGFRRFLQTLSTKEQSEAEIRDNIEYMVNQYGNAMRVHHMEASSSSFEVFVITPLEILENLVKFKWSAIAKGFVSVKRRQVELLKAEMGAAGKECAYIFDARQRF